MCMLHLYTVWFIHLIVPCSVLTVERGGGHSKRQAQLPSGRAGPNGVHGSSTERSATPVRGVT